LINLINLENTSKRQIRHIQPCEILREEVIYANELTITEAAKMLGQSLDKIIHEKSDITPEMSFRIALYSAILPNTGLTYKPDMICS
jgi:plasmid maintenance system antidote protein VapI